MKHFYKKWKKEVQNKFLTTINVSLLMISTFFQAQAQVNTTYAFSAFPGTYTSLVGATSSSIALTADGGMSTNIPIGFSFVYNAINYTNLRVSSDGFLVFGTAGTTTLTNNLATTTLTQRPGLAPLWDDLQCTEGVKYQTNGVAPNRTFTVEWQNMEWNWSSNVTGISFQVVLYETSNIIDFIYRQESNPGNPGGSGGASIGIMGSVATDYISLQNTSATPTTSTTTSTNTLSAKPLTDQVYRWIGPPPTPPTPTQAAGIPSCATGTDIDVTGTPDVDIAWYWQSSAIGTSMTNQYTGPYTVFSNGTYYLRAYNTVSLTWSTNSSSIDISNFPLAPTPLAPIASQNPACITNGSELTAAPAPAGLVYYWQGTNSNGNSQLNDASLPLNVNASGTYYLNAFETASSCWSNSSSISVTINSYIPEAPIGVDTVFYLCSGATSQTIVANSPASGSQEYILGTNLSNFGALTIPFTANALPSGATVTSASIMLSNVNSVGGSFRSEIRVALSGFYTLAPTQISTLASAGLISPDPSINLVGFPTTGGSGNLLLTETFDDGGATTVDATFGQIKLVINYSIPASTINWYDQESNGTLLGTGSPFESVGTSILASPATQGEYTFYAESESGGCFSTNRTPITVSVNSVNVEIIPTSVTCNNGIDGTFTLGTTNCGIAPFNFSVDASPFGGIPNNLTVGNHTVIVQDGASNLSSTYTITIGDALAPSGLVINTYSNDMIDVSWVANGSESAWNIEWGAPGFVPGTGAEIGSGNATDTNFVVAGLDGSTEYDVYISADCGIGSTPGSWIMINETTTCDAIAAQSYCESFEDIPSLACWLVLNENLDTDLWQIQTNPTYSNTGNNSAQLYTDFNGGNNNDWLVLPKMTLTGNEIMSFNYRVRSVGEPNDFRVVLSTNGIDPSDFTEELMALNTYSNIVYQDTALNLSSYTGEVYIAFHVPSGGLDGYYLYIDDVCIDICIPAPGTDGNTDVCRLDGVVNLNTVITQGENNGVWNFPPNQSAVSGSDINVAAIPDGTFEMYYVVTTACTVDTTVATLTIYPPSSAGTNGQINVCKNQPVNLLAGLSGLVDHGGTWYNPSNVALTNGQITSGALPGQFNYNYITSNGVCPNDTANVILNISATCDWTGIEELNANAITVYPNPSTGLFYIYNSDASQNFNYEVLDLNGRVISESTKEVNGSATIEVDLTNVENGIYMIKLFNESGAKLVRVVKQ